MSAHPSGADTAGMDPRVYRVVIRGEFGGRLSGLFAGWSVETSHGETALEGRVRDQAELHGLLSRLRSMGIDLISVNPIGTHRPADADSEHVWPKR